MVSPFIRLPPVEKLPPERVEEARRELFRLILRQLRDEIAANDNADDKPEAEAA